MSPALDDATLLQRIRRHDAEAWETLIARYQGRLLAFASSRLQDATAAEDVVQETFLGFLTSLPNYDEGRTPLEAFLFSIAAHKLTDALRRRQIRPRLLGSFASAPTDQSAEPASRTRKVSSLARSRERYQIAERILGQTLTQLVQTWISRAEFERLKCAELLFAVGLPNQEVAAKLGLSEQSVANHKSFVLQKLKTAAAAARLREDDWHAT